MEQIRRIADEMDNEERRLLKQRADEVESAASGAKTNHLFRYPGLSSLVTGAGLTITRSLSGQIGQAVNTFRVPLWSYKLRPINRHQAPKNRPLHERLHGLSAN